MNRSCAHHRPEPKPEFDDDVQETRDRAITVVTIDRPKAHNAVNHETAVALAQAINRFRDDDEAAVLILTGAGPKSFSHSCTLAHGGKPVLRA